MRSITTEAASSLHRAQQWLAAHFTFILMNNVSHRNVSWCRMILVWRLFDVSQNIQEYWGGCQRRGPVNWCQERKQMSTSNNFHTHSEKNLDQWHHREWHEKRDKKDAVAGSYGCQVVCLFLHPWCIQKWWQSPNRHRRDGRSYDRGPLSPHSGCSKCSQFSSESNKGDSHRGYRWPHGRTPVELLAVRD